jgi:hypothetical protein
VTRGIWCWLRAHRSNSSAAAVNAVKLNNCALVPASLLPFKEQWQEVANSKAGEHVLIVLPKMNKRPRSVLERVAAQLREKGHDVTTLSAGQFGQPAEEDLPAASLQPRLFSVSGERGLFLCNRTLPVEMLQEGSGTVDGHSLIAPEFLEVSVTGH